MSEEQKKRGPRTTKNQIDMIINFIEQNPILISGNNDEGKWNELTVLLNSSAGAIKTTQQWKKTVGELKTNVKRRAREISLANQATGGGPMSNVKKLTDSEERLLGLISKVVIDGAPIQEFGLISQDTQEITLDIDASITDEILLMEVSNENKTQHENVANENKEVIKTPKRKRSQPANTELNDLAEHVHEQTDTLRDLADSIRSLSSAISSMALAIDKLAVNYK